MTALIEIMGCTQLINPRPGCRFCEAVSQLGLTVCTPQSLLKASRLVFRTQFDCKIAGTALEQKDPDELIQSLKPSDTSYTSIVAQYDLHYTSMKYN
jgi:hypothetical protein